MDPSITDNSTTSGDEELPVEHVEKHSFNEIGEGNLLRKRDTEDDEDEPDSKRLKSGIEEEDEKVDVVDPIGVDFSGNALAGILKKKDGLTRKRRLTFADGNDLQHVRMFLQTDPPAKASATAGAPGAPPPEDYVGVDMEVGGVTYTCTSSLPVTHTALNQLLLSTQSKTPGGQSRMNRILTSTLPSTESAHRVKHSIPYVCEGGPRYNPAAQTDETKMQIQRESSNVGLSEKLMGVLNRYMTSSLRDEEQGVGEHCLAPTAVMINLMLPKQEVEKKPNMSSDKDSNAGGSSSTSTSDDTAQPNLFIEFDLDSLFGAQQQQQQQQQQLLIQQPVIPQQPAIADNLQLSLAGLTQALSAVSQFNIPQQFSTNVNQPQQQQQQQQQQFSNNSQFNHMPPPLQAQQQQQQPPPQQPQRMNNFGAPPPQHFNPNNFGAPPPNRPQPQQQQQQQQQQHHHQGPPPQQHHLQGPPPPRNQGGYNQGPPPPPQQQQQQHHHHHQGPPPPRNQGGYNQGPPPQNYNQGPPPRNQGGYNQGPPPQNYNQGGYNNQQQNNPNYNQRPPPQNQQNMYRNQNQDYSQGSRYPPNKR